MGETVDRAALGAAARLFGDLLLVELDPARLEQLLRPEVAEQLTALGIELPDGGAKQLDALAAEYHAGFLTPDRGGAPPVGSLWTEGRFEARFAVRIRELASSAALDFDRAVAVGAPVDHLGVILHLWATALDRAPWVADEIAAEHLAWCETPLARVAAGDSAFYASLARATSQLVGVIRATA